MKMKKILIVTVQGLVILGAIVLTNFFFGCKDPYARNQMHGMERERMRAEMEAKLKQQEQEKEILTLKKKIEELKKAEQQ